MKSFALLATLLLAGCSLLHSPPAEAATSVVTWTNPDHNTDTSPIVDTGDETSLASWRIEYGTCTAPNVFGVAIGQVIRTRSGAALISVTVNTQSGLKCFRVFVTNVAGIESDASNIASRTIAPPKPNPATSVAAS